MLIPDVHDGVLPNTRVNIGARGSGGRGAAPWVLPFTVENANARQWLDCIDGQYIKDRVNTGSDRILNGGPGLQRGRCYDFDGVDDYVDSDSVLSIGTNDVSLSVWFYTDSVASQRTLVSFSDNSTEILKVFHDTTGHLNFYARTGGAGGADRQIKASVSTGEWHHLVMTRSGTTITFYVDNVSEYSDTHADFATSLDYVFRLGSDQTAGLHWDGKIFGAIVYDDILTADEIEYVYGFGLKGGTNPYLFNAVCMWLMDEQSGITAYDAAGNGFTGTLNGGVAHSTQDLNSYQNRFGYSGAMSFDGSNDFVNVGQNHAAASGSISVWVFGNGDYLADRIVGDAGGYIYVEKSSTTEIRAVCFDTGSKFTSAVTFTANVWHHVVITWDSSMLRLYLDGSLVSSKSMSGALGSVAYDLQFGGTGGVTWDGMQFGARLDAAALTADQVTYLYTFGASGDDPGAAVGEWLLNKGDARDSSGNGNHGTVSGASPHYLPKNYSVEGSVDINGAPLDYSGHAPLHGKLVNSFCGDFDGTDDHATISADSSLDLTTAGTISFWLNADSFGNCDLVVKGAGGAGAAQNYLVAVFGGTFYFVLGDGVTFSSATFTVAGNLSTGTDHHVVCVFDDTDQRIYIDGVQQAINAAPVTPASNSDPLTFSGSAWAGANYNGKLWDVRLFDARLSESELGFLGSGSGTDPGTDDLVGWWPLAEGLGITAYDVSGNGNHATLNNITAATFWSASQDKLAYNIQYGFRTAFGIRVPHLIDGSGAADGGVLGDAVGCWHNDAETEIDFNPYDIPELKTHQIGFDAYRAFNIREDEFKRPDQQWAHRESEVKIHHFATFDAQLTGSDRDNAWEYYAVVARLNAQVIAAWKFEETSVDYTGDYLTHSAVGSRDLFDASSGSNTVPGGKDGRMLEMYMADPMLQNTTDMTAVKAFAFSCWVYVYDNTDDIVLLDIDSGQVEVKFNGGSGRIDFLYNGTTIVSSGSMSTGWHHVFAGIDDYGNMHLWVGGVWQSQAAGVTMKVSTTTWKVGNASPSSGTAGMDEAYIFTGKRSRGMLMSKLFNGPTYISAGGVFS